MVFKNKLFMYVALGFFLNQNCFSQYSVTLRDQELLKQHLNESPEENRKRLKLEAAEMRQYQKPDESPEENRKRLKLEAAEMRQYQKSNIKNESIDVYAKEKEAEFAAKLKERRERDESSAESLDRLAKRKENERKEDLAAFKSKAAKNKFKETVHKVIDKNKAPGVKKSGVKKPGVKKIDLKTSPDRKRREDEAREQEDRNKRQHDAIMKAIAEEAEKAEKERDKMLLRFDHSRKANKK